MFSTQICLHHSTDRCRDNVIVASRDDVAIASKIRSSEDLPRASEKVKNALLRDVRRGDIDTISATLQEENLGADLVIDDIGTTLLQHAVEEGRL